MCPQQGAAFERESIYGFGRAPRADRHAERASTDPLVASADVVDEELPHVILDGPYALMAVVVTSSVTESLVELVSVRARRDLARTSRPM
jgi:hypothetical protein